jgi:hypothetical protein
MRLYSRRWPDSVPQEKQQHAANLPRAAADDGCRMKVANVTQSVPRLGLRSRPFCRLAQFDWFVLYARPLCYFCVHPLHSSAFPMMVSRVPDPSRPATRPSSTMSTFCRYGCG